MQNRSVRIAALSLASFLPVLAAPAAGGDAAVPTASNVRLGEGPVGRAVARAVIGARQRLAENGCQQTLGDFADASGRALGSALDATGLTPAAYLDQVFFYDGSAVRRCQTTGTHAVTMPGSRAVYVCGRSFLKLEHQKPEFAESLIIHEMLHSLGLPTDKPTSWDITLKVRSRCGD